MADVKLLKYDGTEQQYPGVERVQLATVGGGTAIFSYGEAVEGIEISPDFSAGDMTVDAPAGKLVKSAVIVKPENLIPENVRRGVNVAGIEGNLIGDTETVTVGLNMAEGDQIILPTQEGKAMSQVMVTRPDTLIPENILAGVDIGGVVGQLSPPDSVEKEIALDFSDGAMEVIPDEGTVFSKVNIPIPEGLSPENIAKDVTVAGITGIHSGGNVAYTFDEENENIVHAKLKDFKKLPVALFSGFDKLQSVDLSESPNISKIMKTVFQNCKELLAIEIPDSVTSIGNDAFRACYGLTSIKLPANLEIIGNYAFINCTGLTSITIPKNVTKIGYYAFANDNNIKSVVFEELYGWYVAETEYATSGTTLNSSSLRNTSTAAVYLTDTYKNYYWHRR